MFLTIDPIPKIAPTMSPIIIANPDQKAVADEQKMLTIIKARNPITIKPKPQASLLVSDLAMAVK